MPFVLITDTPPAMPYGAFSNLLVTADILSVSDSHRLEQVPRVTVGVTEIAVRSVSWSGDSTRTGVEFGAVLQRISDRQYITDDALITFEIGERESGEDDFTYKTIIDSQPLQNTTFSIHDDTVSFNTRPNNKLTICPTENLIICDSANVPDISEVESKVDTEGRTYGTNITEIDNLTWKQAADEVFVNILGFDSIETDIDDFIVNVFHFPMAVPYLEGFKADLGTFKPRIYPVGNVLHIKNGWALAPSDFPAPVDLTEFKCERAEVVRERSFYDCVELSYAVSSQYDYRTARSEIKTTDNGGSIIDGNLITTVTTKVFYDYYLYTSSIPQNTELGQTLIERFNGLDVLSNKVYEENNVFRYDAQARLLSTTKTVSEKIPDEENPGSKKWQTESRLTFTNIAYAQFPFDIRRQYEKSITHLESELHVIDADNPYDWDETEGQFTQSLTEAKRTGSMKPGFTYSEGVLPTKTITDHFTPQRNGQVAYNRTAYDHIQQGEIYNHTEARVGDVSLNGKFSRTATLYVFETPSTTKGDGQILSVAGGIVPKRILVPLCRNILIKLRQRNRRATLSRIGIDTNINLGYQFSATSKQNQLEGKFVVESYSCSGSRGENGNVWTMQITGGEL